MKNGKIVTTCGPSNNKDNKFPGGFQKKKEGEISVVSANHRRNHPGRKKLPLFYQKLAYPVQHVQPYVEAIAMAFNQ